MSQRLLKGGVRVKDEMQILCGNDLGSIHETATMKSSNPILERAGLKLGNSQCLRHSHPWNLIALDMHAKFISERSGYKAIKITLDKYGHLMTHL